MNRVISTYEPKSVLDVAGHPLGIGGTFVYMVRQGIHLCCDINVLSSYGDLWTVPGARHQTIKEPVVRNGSECPSRSWDAK